MIDTFSIKLTQFEKNESKGEVFIRVGNLKSTFETGSRSCLFALISISYLESAIYLTAAAEFEVNKFDVKKAYITKCIQKCNNMYECTTAVIRAI